MKVYVLTMGRNLYYVTKNIEDAEYEKGYTEDETFQGRKLGIKLTEIEIPKDWENHIGEKINIRNGVSYTIEEIMNLL